MTKDEVQHSRMTFNEAIRDIEMFITFEGIEGSGKTTQIRHAMEFLKQRGKDCIVTREPGGTVTGRKIRAILLDPESKGMDPSTELLLYMADRAEHVNKVVKPSLSAGKTVLCDRYYDATIAYQGYARGLDMDLLSKLHRLIINDLKPDMTILLDLPPEAGLSRAWKADRGRNREPVLKQDLRKRRLLSMKR